MHVYLVRFEPPLRKFTLFVLLSPEFSSFQFYYAVMSATAVQKVSS